MDVESLILIQENLQLSNENKLKENEDLIARKRID